MKFWFFYLLFDICKYSSYLFYATCCLVTWLFRMSSTKEILEQTSIAPHCFHVLFYLSLTNFVSIVNNFVHPQTASDYGYHAIVDLVQLLSPVEDHERFFVAACRAEG